MLRSLYIENFALIDKETINFENNFTAITGDTGAGKSTILNALDIVNGDSRAKNRVLKNKEKNAVIIGEFDISNCKDIHELLKENFIQIDENSLLIKKVITPNSGSRVFINEMPSNIGLVNKITQKIIEVSNQFEQSELLEDNSCLKMIDSYIENRSIFTIIKSSYLKYVEAKNELENIEKSHQNFLNDQEYILNMKSELEEIMPISENEEEELIGKKSSLLFGANISKISKQLLEILNNEDLQKRFSKMIKIIESNVDLSSDSEIQKQINDNIYQLLYNVSENINSIENEISDISSEYSNTADELEEIELRLLKIREISKKYKITVSDLQKKYEEISSFVDISENFTENEEKAKKKLEISEKEYLDFCENLTNIRKSIAQKIEFSIHTELEELAMKDAQVMIDFKKSNYSEFGLDAVSFVGKMNKGYSFESLKNIVSGGESTRLVLALKIVFANQQSINTIVFDEIDSGVSGEILYKIGKKMKSLSSKYQIIAITHNPQVAMFADHHLYIYKTVNDSDITESKVKTLQNSEVDKRLAHMIYGESIGENEINKVRQMRLR